MKIKNCQSGLAHITVVALVVLVLCAVGIVGWKIWENKRGVDVPRPITKNNLPKEELRDLFECDRITADVRETDIFCQNPTFYNNPDDVTIQMYYDYLSCRDRLKNPPSPESDIYLFYETCKDNGKLDTGRKELIQNLKQLKSKL